ncbi:DNA repair protein RecO [Ammoniphilus oxalaticus]|uniref:DNA repair protein RecO n=1 Tax=Ammoniphilus oxalaticus TaxID=66863 RepID=A0A419SJ13_9BACL|nr:DNA repair protein RecO [Ammoniphilus oxalaticus]RKD24011.1 DNA repair protein RecO [Ammoniphilus oxalaticus]
MLGRAEGIVLRTQDYGEGNKIITVFTLELGKIGVMARGARKTKSRFGAITQPFIHALFFFHMGTTGLASLNQADLIQSFTSIRGDLYKTSYAGYMTELTDRFCEDRQSNPVLFRLLLESLKQIEQGKDEEIITRIFEIKILSMYGFKPILNNCVICQNGREPWFFSVQEGGIVCDSCRRRDPYAFLLPENIARLLYTFQTMDIAQLGEIKIRETTRSLLKRVTYEFIDAHTGVRLKTRRFLEQLDALEQYIPRKERQHGDATDASGSGSDC